MENLIKLFKCSPDRVIITDYDFNILWRNKNEEIFSLCDENCADLFENDSLPLESGSYFIKHNGLFFKCKVINYPDCKDGVYVIQTDIDDIMFSFVKCKNIREILENQSGCLRDAVAGISLSNDMLRATLNKARAYSDQKYLDITAGNCCKILRTSSDFTELIRYADGSIDRKKIDLSAVINAFAEKSNDIFCENVQVITNINENLYISADLNRFEAFLLSLVVVVNDNNKENNIITISAERITDERKGDAVSITVAPDCCGTDNIGRIFSEHIELYGGEESNFDLLIINRFCKAFDGTLIVSENSNKKKCFNIKLPYCNEDSEAVQINTASESYQDNKFSNYNIKYSKILY